MPFGASYSCSVDLTEEACNARLEEENGNVCIMRLTSFLPGVTVAESGKQQRKHIFYWSVRGSVRVLCRKSKSRKRKKLLLKAV